jgi:hypothetical protein
VVSGEIANVRTGPGTNYPVIGQIRQGETYPLTGRNASGGWWEFAFGQRTGWISASLVESNEQAASVQVSANVPPAPTATATPTPQPTSPPVAAGNCPAWYQPPQPGMGVLVIENHDTGTVAARIEEIWTPFEQSLPQKINDVPGRLTVQLNPGRHLFKIEFPVCCEVILEVDIEAGRAYIAPIVKPGLDRTRPFSREVLKPVAYPLVPPAGC